MTSPNAPRWARAAATLAALVPLTIAATVGAAYASDEPAAEPTPVVEPAPETPAETPTEVAPEASADLTQTPEASAEAPAPAPVPVPEPAASTNDPQEPEEPTAPTATVTYPAPPAGAVTGWFNDAVPVTITGTATAPATVAEIVWSLSGAMTDSGTHNGSSTTVTIDVENRTTLEYYVVDSEGLASEVESIVFALDLVAPAPTLTTPDATTEYFAGQELAVNFSCGDSFVWICYLEDLTTGDRYSETGVITLVEGVQNYRLTVMDLVRRTATIDRQITVLPAPDTAGPEVVVTPGQTVPDTGWYRNAVMVNSSATDPSGVVRIEYRRALTGGGWTDWSIVRSSESAPTELDGSVQFFLSGQYVTQFRAVDAVGNTSDVVDFSARVDKEITPATIAGFRSEFVQGESYTPVIECTDVMSGTSTCSSSLGASGTALPTETLGDHTFTTTHSDVAGNSVTTTWTYTVVADATLPVTTATPSATGWTAAESVDVMIRATDDVTVASVWVEASGADGMPLRSVEGNAFLFTATTEGVTTITAYALDAAGNRSADVTVTVRIDRTLPTVTITSPANRVDSLVATADFTQGQVVDLEFECADAGSGIATCAATDEATTLPTGELGDHSIDIVAVDAAGNRVTRTLDYTVVAAPAQEPAPTPVPLPVGVLAFTGNEIWFGLLFVAALLAAGATALTVSRSRRP